MLKSFLQSKNYTAVKLELTKTNHFSLKARINGTEGTFILDTGASNTCISVEKAELFVSNSKESEIKAAGAGATNMDTSISSNNTIEIGLWKKQRQQIVLFDLVHVNEALTAHESTAVDGIIGADILRKNHAVIDYSTNTLFLKL